MKGNSNERIIRSVLGTISLVLALILSVIIFNTFFQWIPTQTSEWQGIIVLAPFILAPMGAVLGLISFVRNRDSGSKWGLLLNLAVFLFLVGYIIMGNVLIGE